ncbi:hypothetical protein BDY24DRAFT_412781 [Mrakia frigida]|uniref:uncharacterized protein n=1 Tax=Mrakia frigida TaxID=29902 RepID=UPI003FCC0B80
MLKLRLTTLSRLAPTFSLTRLGGSVRNKTTVEAMKETAEKVNKETGKVLAEALEKAEKVTSTLTGSNIDPLEAAKPSAQDDNNNNQDESTKTRKDSVIMSSDGSFEVPLDEEMKK